MHCHDRILDQIRHRHASHFLIATQSRLPRAISTSKVADIVHVCAYTPWNICVYRAAWEGSYSA
eukprot:4622079-Heterocapsa_arctica.AAC.1